MRVSSAVVRFVLKKNRKNKMGEYPVYSARHSFAQHYLSTPNATIAGLASLLARSPNTIATYIAQIKRNEDVASMVENMPI